MTSLELLKNNAGIKEAQETIGRYRQHIILFVYEMWGLSPQPPKPEFRQQFLKMIKSEGDEWLKLRKTVNANWFGDCVNEETGEWNWYKFQKGKHITWQQTLILLGIEKAVADNGVPRRLSVVSGHGIGKSATISWFIIWFLFCFDHSQVPVTAPTSHQMHDVLWKELSIWIGKMPSNYSAMYEWSRDYVKVKYDPNSWFARARTSTKENTEAIAGVHADNVAVAVDEASGVPEQVFNTAEGALTSGNVFMLLISNGTRPDGYFYDTQHKNVLDWQDFSFNGEQSPVVDRDFINLKRVRHGKLSDEYKIRVAGGFPGESAMDDSGYLQLISPTKVIVTEPVEGLLEVGRKILGIDPSGEGKDAATFVLRNRFRAQKIHELLTTNPRQVAEVALTLIAAHNIDPNDVVIDSFGIGSDVGKEIALASKGAIETYTVLVGNRPIDEENYNGRFFRIHDDEKGDKDDDLYLNLRALMFFRARGWLIAGGQIIDGNVDNSHFADEITSIKYKRTLNGNKIQLMPKEQMQKLRIKSPNIADAFALTFLRDLEEPLQSKEEKERIAAEENEAFDPYAAI